MRVLVVEDEPFIALDLADELSRAGHTVIGPALRANEALELVRSVGCDIAVLDVNLGQDTTSEEVALALAARAIPFITVSGYAPGQYPLVFATSIKLSKPLVVPQLLEAIARTPIVPPRRAVNAA